MISITCYHPTSTDRSAKPHRSREASELDERFRRAVYLPNYPSLFPRIGFVAPRSWARFTNAMGKQLASRRNFNSEVNFKAAVLSDSYWEMRGSLDTRSWASISGTQILHSKSHNLALHLHYSYYKLTSTTTSTTPNTAKRVQEQCYRANSLKSSFSNQRSLGFSTTSFKILGRQTQRATLVL